METIIVQEKDASILDILTIALQMAGFNVCALSACDETLLQSIEQQRPDAVILDYEFEDRDCVQMRQLIKERNARLPVLAMSCNNNIQE